MAKQTCAFTLFLSVLLILFGCKNQEKPNLGKSNTILVINSIGNRDSLVIEGNNIWIRDHPEKGEVVMKLNENDRCVILDTSKLDTIKGYIDYWYQIKYNDTIGWVFGSQTNIKSAKSKETQSFLRQNKAKLKCSRMDYSLVSKSQDGYDLLSFIVLFSGNTILDTLNFRGKRVSFSEKKYAQVQLEDYNFDGLCDLLLTNDMTASHGAVDTYYFLFDIETKKYIEDTSLPNRNGGVTIDPNKKEVVIYCSYRDCKASYKYIDGEFKRVSGKFMLDL